MNTITRVLVSACILVAVTACSRQPDDAPAKDVSTRRPAEYFGSCEDQCGECETYNRCHQPGGTTRYYCVPNGNGCTSPTSIACMCCSDNQIRVGDYWTGHCEDCPAGQVADQLSGGNYCCTPKTQEEVCGNQCSVTLDDGCANTYNCTCAAGSACVNGTCSPCAPLTQQQACGDMHCGTVSDGCGGTYTCGVCGAQEYCGSGNYCYCSYPYLNCGDPLPARPQCYSICP